MPSGRTNNLRESGRGLGHVTPTIFGSTVGYPSDSLASCLFSVYFLRASCSIAMRKSSVRLSITLVDCDHIDWNSSKIISRLVSRRQRQRGEGLPTLTSLWSPWQSPTRLEGDWHWPRSTATYPTVFRTSVLAPNKRIVVATGGRGKTRLTRRIKFTPCRP